MIKLIAQNISKSYNNTIIIDDFNYQFENGKIYGIIGANGTGKSTLMKLLSMAINAESGQIILEINSNVIEKNNYYQHISFSAPYLNLYSDLNIFEHIKIISNFKSQIHDEALLCKMMKDFKLESLSKKPIKQFSSGMLQKVKLLLAFIYPQSVLLLDEPTVNLDENGAEIVLDYINNRQNNSIIIIASNEAKEIQICTDIINIQK